MWDSLLAEHYGSFVGLENKSAHFDGGSFTALLETVKQYGEQGYIPRGTAGRAGDEAMLPRAGGASGDRYFFKQKNAVNLLALFARNLNMNMTGMAEGGSMALEDDDEIAGIAAAANGSVPFTYNQAYGISANSRNKETAWAFLTFLLSEEMQLSTHLRPTALPIRNSAREKKAEIMLTGMLERQGQSLNEAQREALGLYNDAVERFFDSINAYLFEDTMINDMISAEVAYYFEGTKTADEVADTLQNKVELYLNE